MVFTDCGRHNYRYEEDTVQNLIKGGDTNEY